MQCEHFEHLEKYITCSYCHLRSPNFMCNACCNSFIRQHISELMPLSSLQLQQYIHVTTRPGIPYSPYSINIAWIKIGPLKVTTYIGILITNLGSILRGVRFHLPSFHFDIFIQIVVLQTVFGLYNICIVMYACMYVCVCVYVCVYIIMYDIVWMYVFIFMYLFM